MVVEHDNAPSDTSSSARKFLSRNNLTVVFHPPYFFVLLRLKIIEAESQAVLNTQDALKNWQKLWERRMHAEGGLLRGRWWPVGPKLVFDQMAAPVPEIMDGSSYIGRK
jgi:hypothetical protein